MSGWLGKSRVAVGLLLCVILFTAPHLLAQMAAAAVNGVISDASGAVIPGASVTLKNVDTGVEVKTTSNGSGTYVFLNITPGSYSLQTEKSGFERVAQPPVKLDVDQTATFNFHLTVGATQDTVTVDADSAGVEASTSELGTVINSKEVNDLPLNGRNFTQLLTLTPGVAPINTDQTGSGGGGFVGHSLGSYSFPAVNGQRVRSNLFLLDGVNNQNTFLSLNNYSPIPDAISEFKVQTHNDDTEYGGIIGGLVNVVSRSGTNQYHGSLWEYIRNNRLDANSFYNNLQGLPRNGLRQNQFGGALGGPVWIPKLYNGHNRTFFFAAYEGYRFNQASQLTQVSPSPAMRAGNFAQLCYEGFSNGLCRNPVHQLYDPYSTVPDPANPGGLLRSPFLNNLITRPLDPVALAYQNVFPQGTIDPNPNNLAGLYIAVAPGGNTVNQDEGQVRVDQSFGTKDQIYGRFAKYYQMDTLPQTVVQQHVAPIYGYNWTIHETHTFNATSILDAYVARNYGNNEQTLTVPGGATLLSALQQAGVSQAFLTLGDLVTAPAMGFGGVNYESIGFQQSQATSLADVWEYGGTFTKILGRHIVKAGGAISTNGFYSPIRGSHETFATNQTAGLGANLGIGGDSYASFLLGAPDNAGNRVVNETVHGGYSNNAYIHDQWKVTDRLTINGGLRYDLKLWPIYGSGTDLYTGEPNPVTGQYIITALPPTCSATQGAPCIPAAQYVNCNDPNNPSCINGQAPFSGLAPHVIVNPNGSGAIINNDYGDFAVRVGFAYRASNKLAIRGGYGRFYDTWGASAQDAQNFNGNWPATNLEVNGLNRTTVNSPITNPLHLGSAGGGLVYPTTAPYDAGTWSVDPNYKTPYSDQYNFGFQEELPGNTVLDVNYVGSVSKRLDVTDVLNVAPTPGPGNPVAREPFPYMGNPWFQQSIGSSNFNALEISLNRRASNNLSYIVSYTWSKSMDDGCSADIGADCSIQNVYNRQADYSVSTFNIPQVFSAAVTATSPYGKGRELSNRFANAVVGGWALNTIVSLHSGLSFDVGAPASIPNICYCSNTVRASTIGDPHASGGRSFNKPWFNTANIVTPAPYTFGNLGRNSLRGDWGRNTDLSLFRQFGVGLGEERYLEFRAEAFNAFNNVVFNTPNTNIGSSQFGFVDGTQLNAPRILQFALKFEF